MSVTAPTHHITAQVGEFAKTVLMPGDPLRAKYIAENLMENAVQINSVRCYYGYTGTYKGKEVSVLSSGIGMPSMGCYSWELYNLYDVDNIIRIGTTGAMHPDVKVRDVIIAMAASTDSNYAYQYEFPGTFAPCASYELLRKATDAAEKMGISYRVGNIFTTDLFYNHKRDITEKCRQLGLLCVEMETAALYCNAAYFGKKALSILTVSDHLLTGEKTSADEREKSFRAMMDIALEIV